MRKDLLPDTTELNFEENGEMMTDKKKKKKGE